MDRHDGGADEAAAENVVTPRSCSRRGRHPQIYVDDKVKDYIVDVVFATREPGRSTA
jgi:MoxR-like ATPase